MSRQRERIRRAVESRGYRAVGIAWEPIYYAGEMSGYAGGWNVTLDRPYAEHTYPGNEVFGLSVEEVLADIDWSLTPTESCRCYPDDRPGRHPLHTIKGDPERPLHEPHCRWHIPYRLRWWRRDVSPSVFARGVS